MLGTQGNPSPISNWVRASAGLSRAEFVSKHSQPVFLIEPFDETDSTGFSTIAGVKGAGDGDLVVVLKKRRGANAFAHMITIGRSGNNDVVIAYPGVSKFHAFLPVPAEGIPCQLVDAGSSNGTFVRDVQLEGHGEPAALEPGIEVRFSDLRVTYHDAASLFDLLGARR